MILVLPNYFLLKFNSKYEEILIWITSYVDQVILSLSAYGICEVSCTGSESGVIYVVIWDLPTIEQGAGISIECN